MLNIVEQYGRNYEKIHSFFPEKNYDWIRQFVKNLICKLKNPRQILSDREKKLQKALQQKYNPHENKDYYQPNDFKLMKILR